ncbi:gastrula zinc finger protein XlCGF7.1-like [Cydia strobilella]|uniref:gastrula zinc finger protein XlCGF7.1-like n=1 Tax=Cydia strobilella TaxID=1100964 RepID=UPI003003B0E9
MRIASTLVSAAVSGRGRRSTRRSTGWGRSCSVRLERLLVDAARRTCQVGRRKYKLRTTEPAHTHKVTTTIFQCHHCGKQFRNKSVLKKHVHIHSSLHNSTREDHSLENKKYSDKKYTSDRKINPRRRGMKHSSKKQFQPKCDTSDEETNLQAHLIIRTGEKPFRCSHCGYKCKKKSGIMSHLMIHTGDKPFQCSYCDHRSRRKGHLRIHEMTHTGKTPFVCDQCDKKCFTQGSLHRHLLIHTDEKPYKCTYCDYRSRQQVNIRSHEMTHAGEKPFKCNYCNYKCRHKRQLRNHEMKHTDEELDD